MIIQVLCEYYDILDNDPTVPISRPGYSSVNVSFNLVISETGDISHIVDLRSDDKKPRPRTMMVPQQNSRANGINPYFLCDSVKYVFGVEKIKRAEFEKKYLNRSDSETAVDYVVLEENEKEVILTNARAKEYFETFRKLHNDILGNMDFAGVKRLLLFLEKWNPKEFLKNPKIVQYKDDILAGGNFVFGYEDAYIHQNSKVKALWEKHNSDSNTESAVFSPCLVSGETEPVANVHQKIKGIIGAHTAGASLVSFNDKAFESYNKVQSYNAPVSRNSMFKYTTTLNYLLNQKDNRLRIADATTVFWAETSDKTCENLARFFINPPTVKKDDEKDSNDSERIRDAATLQLVEDVLTKVKNGKSVRKEDIGTDPDVNFYILGLSPNNARIAVRFWYKDSFGNFVETVAQHHQDMEIIPEYSGDYEGPKFVSVYWLLRETVPPQSSDKNDVSPILGGLLMRAILHGTPYPLQMYSAILNRVKVERSINDVRAGFIKAYLLRQSRAGLINIPEELITIKLNEESENVPYRLGRLFSVLEKVQSDTNKSIGSTINSKYFSSASSTPAVVFPVLLKLAQHHINKSDWGFKTNQAIEEILSEVNEFPAFLNLDEQGMFMLGYYHQRKANYQKKSEKTVEEE